MLYDMFPVNHRLKGEINTQMDRLKLHTTNLKRYYIRLHLTYSWGFWGSGAGIVYFIDKFTGQLSERILQNSC